VEAQAEERQAGSDSEPAGSGRAERRTDPVELFWDLVFVFAITQVTSLLFRHPTWGRVGESMLVLALVWWAWSAFVWAANAQDAGSPTLRLSLLTATIFIFIAGLAVPHAFSGEATLFAATYAVVRVLHLGLYVDASRRGNAAWSSIVGFAITVLIGMALLIVGSFLHGLPRAALWIGAVAIDYAGPAWLTRERLRGLQEVAVAHFAERYSLFVIICLGESIVAIGVSAVGQKLDAALLAAVSFGMLILIGLWWTYFGQFAAAAEERLRQHADPVLAAADAYSYLHLLLVAGIIIFAVGVRFAAHAADQALADPGRLSLCGGVALYLLGHLAVRWRLLGSPFRTRSQGGMANVVVAAALLLLFALGGGLPAWAVTGAAAALVTLLCTVQMVAD
jgi:low temperature requirement protein LtrA